MIKLHKLVRRRYLITNLVHAHSLQSCLTLCDPTDCSSLGSSIHGTSQARILEWIAIPFSRGSFWPRCRTRVSYVSCIADGFFITKPLGSPINLAKGLHNKAVVDNIGNILLSMLEWLFNLLGFRKTHFSLKCQNFLPSIKDVTPTHLFPVHVSLDFITKAMQFIGS